MKTRVYLPKHRIKQARGFLQKMLDWQKPALTSPDYRGRIKLRRDYKKGDDIKLIGWENYSKKGVHIIFLQISDAILWEQIFKKKYHTEKPQPKITVPKVKPARQPKEIRRKDIIT